MRPIDVVLVRTSRGGGGGGAWRQWRLRSSRDRSDVLSAVLGGGVRPVTALTGLGLTDRGAGSRSSRARRTQRRGDAWTALLGSADGDGGEPALARVEEAYPTAALHRDVGRAFNLTTAGGVVAMSEHSGRCWRG
jgi:hypothetical protein